MSMQSSPPPGRGHPLLVGVLTFVVVFLLIVGATVAVQVFRSVSDPGPTASAEPTEADDEDPAATDPAGEDPDEDPAAASDDPARSEGAEPEEYCWYNMDAQRTSENPSGRLRGGGLEFAPPPDFDERSNSTQVNFADDPQVAGAEAEDNWGSVIMVGAVTWQEGYEYPGEEIAAERILDCYIANSGVWGETTNRRPENREGEAVAVEGMDGYRSSADLMFRGRNPLENIDGAAITVVVLDTPEGPSMFVSEAAIGVPEHEDAAVQALESLSGLTD